MTSTPYSLKVSIPVIDPMIVAAVPIVPEYRE
jgi:hypothetical protein